VTAPVRALLVAVVLASFALVAPGARAGPPADRPHAFVLLAPGASLARLLAVRDVAALARTGGAGWASPAREMPDASALVGALRRADAAGPNAGTATILTVSDASASLARSIADIRAAAAQTPGRPVLVLVAGGAGSRSMIQAKDELRPVVVATGRGAGVFAGAGAFGTVTSDSTRRTGIVASADIEPTIEVFLNRSTAGGAGNAIRTLRDDPPPFDLHERYVDMRRMWIPVQVGAAGYAALAGVLCIVALALGRRVPAVIGLTASGAAISVGPLVAALLAAGHLPTLSYGTVVPFVVLVTLLAVGLVLLATGDGVLHPMLPLGLALLAFLAIEDLLGWTAALTPFLGGSELDGGRFYGLPNVFIGLLLGASLYAAARLPALGGFAILLGAAMLAGLPFAGANLGGAATLLVAAGLWLPLRARGRLGPRELAFALAVVVAGTAVVLLAHRFGVPTHVTRFEETRGAGGAWSTFVHRLGVGWALVARNPFALVPVVGLLVTLAVVVRPPGVIAPSLARHPAWRDAVLVMLLSSVAAYALNDTGPAACGVGFGMALGGLLYVSVAEQTWKMAPA
jgi:hypothetical protein